MSNATQPLPNPDVYLNHLPPDIAKQFEIARNIYIAVLGGVACDILSYIPDDIRTVKRSRGYITPVCFLLTRVFALTYISLWVATSTRPIANCTAVTIASNTFCLITMATTGFLFLRRVQAVYADNRYIRWIFSFLWAASCGVVATLIPGTWARHIHGTGYCSVYRVASYVPLADFMPAIFDTLVFLAVSYRLAFQSNKELSIGNQKGWAASWFSTKGLPGLQRAMIQGGQQYYLFAFLLQFVGGIVSFLDVVPVTSKVVCTTPSVALSACLACRAHRIMIDAFHRKEEATLPAMSAMNFAPGNHSGGSNTMTGMEGGFLGHKEVGSNHGSL